MRSFTFSLTLRFALLLSGTTLCVLLLVGRLLHHQGVRSLEVLHEGEFRELSIMLKSDPLLTPMSIAALVHQDTSSDSGLFHTEILGLDGRLLFSSVGGQAARLPVAVKPGKSFTAIVPGYGEMIVSDYHDARLRYLIASPLAPVRSIMEGYIRIAIALFAGVSLAGIGVGYAFARITQRPIRLIREAALEVNAENLGRRIPQPEGRDELAALVLLLNKMFDRLQIAFDQNGRFAADASHELKTPLAVLRLQAEKLRPRLVNDPESLAKLEEILEETAHMHRIIESLLFLAKAESGTLTVAFKDHMVSDLLRDLRDDASVLGEDAGIRVEFSEENDARLRCEPVLLYQMALNLISNSIRYCAKGGLVSIDSRISQDQWTLTVQDEGSGVDPKLLGRLFKRFDRLGQDRSEAGEDRSEGHGLGLAIAQGIASIHRGSITAENRVDRSGLKVTVKLPLAPGEAIL